MLVYICSLSMLKSTLTLNVGRDCVDKLVNDPSVLVKLAQTQMPFGKYKGRLLIDLPEPYVVWFSRQGFPRGELGELMCLLHDIKVNGLEYLFDPLRE